MKRRRRFGRAKIMQHQYGEGFFDDVWSGIKSVGNFVGDKVLPKVIDVGLPLLAKAALGGKKKYKQVAVYGGASQLARFRVPVVRDKVIKA